jgi:hypothetical protein
MCSVKKRGVVPSGQFDINIWERTLGYMSYDENMVHYLLEL